MRHFQYKSLLLLLLIKTGKYIYKKVYYGNASNKIDEIFFFNEGLKLKE